MSADPTSQTFADEPPRVRRFRLALVRAIPRVPNDRAALQHMEQKHLGDVLIDYVNWRSRFVGVRPRRVEIEPVATVDPRWQNMSTVVAHFLEKVRRGDDLTPHLSLAPHTHGYSVAARAPRAKNADKWSDKDFLLNTLGYHHFHLGIGIEPGGYATRTDEVIFARVTREEFKVIAIFGHPVFDLDSEERRRLWELHNEIAFRGVAPGQFVIGAAIATSGHAVHVVRYAQHCLRCICAIDPQMNDSETVKGWFGNAALMAPKKPKLEWMFMHLDFGFTEKTTRTGFWVQKGWN